MLEIGAGVAGAAVIGVEHVCCRDAAWVGEADSADEVRHGSDVEASASAVY